MPANLERKDGRLMARAGRKPTIGRLVLMQAQFHRTVADLSMATGASPDTVRKVLRRAADRGEIVVKRFVQGKSGRAMWIGGTS